MKLFFRFMLISFLLISITACSTPKVFGIPESEWNKAGSLEKETIIENYNQKQMNNPDKCCLRSQPFSSN